MSQIRKSSLALGLLLSLCALSGCGDKNSQATFPHSATWTLAGHSTVAKADIENCTECHGSSLTGGTSKVDCTSQCHLGGADSVHPLSWGKNTAGDTSSIILGHKTSINPASCTTAICHAVGGTARNKMCTTCHVWSATSKHPQDFNVLTNFASHANYVKNTDVAAATCAVASCHGTDLLGNTGVQSSGAFGPSCHACHPGHF
ncbi:MAG: hypothetical protein H7Y05_01505 [Steroidobacteraceae bacterium]|nr:hypothetical protein [Deltaproteobacteria bacterium]